MQDTTSIERERVHFSLDAQLLERLRERARAEDRPQRALIERALRRELAGEPGGRQA